MAWAPAYVTVQDMAAYAKIADTNDNPFLSEVVESASRSIDLTTGRQFGLVTAAEQREFEVEWNHTDGLWEADIDDLMSTVDLVVTVEGLAVPSGEYRLLPRDAPQRGRPWEYLQVEDSTDSTLGVGPQTILVTGWWGWSSPADPVTDPPEVNVPVPVENATKMLAARWLKRRSAPFGVAGSPEMGGELRIDGPDRDVAAMVRPFWALRKGRGFA